MKGRPFGWSDFPLSSHNYSIPSPPLAGEYASEVTWTLVYKDSSDAEKAADRVASPDFNNKLSAAVQLKLGAPKAKVMEEVEVTIFIKPGDGDKGHGGEKGEGSDKKPDGGKGDGDHHKPGHGDHKRGTGCYHKEVQSDPRHGSGGPDKEEKGKLPAQLGGGRRLDSHGTLLVDHKHTR